MANLKFSSPTIRRTAASSAVTVCQHSRRTSYFYTWLLNVLLGKICTRHCSVFLTFLSVQQPLTFFPFFSPGLLIPVDETHPSHLILGVLLTLRSLIPLLQQQVSTISLKGSFGVTRKEADVQPTPEQLLQVDSVLLFFLFF